MYFLKYIRTTHECMLCAVSAFTGGMLWLWCVLSPVSLQSLALQHPFLPSGTSEFPQPRKSELTHIFFLARAGPLTLGERWSAGWVWLTSTWFAFFQLFLEEIMYSWTLQSKPVRVRKPVSWPQMFSGHLTLWLSATLLFAFPLLFCLWNEKLRLFNHTKVLFSP